MNGLVWLVTVAIGFLLFLVLRELWCWYWKINEALEVLKDMKVVLRNIDKNLAGVRVQSAGVQSPDPAAQHFGEPR